MDLSPIRSWKPLGHHGDVDLSGGCLACYSEQDLAVLEGPTWCRTVSSVLSPPSSVITGPGSIGSGLQLAGFGPSCADSARWPDDERRATEDALAAALMNMLERWGTRKTRGPAGRSRVYLRRLAAVARPALTAPPARSRSATPIRDWMLRTRPKVERFAKPIRGCKNARDALIAYALLSRRESSPCSTRTAPRRCGSGRGTPVGYGWLTTVDQDSWAVRYQPPEVRIVVIWARVNGGCGPSSTPSPLGERWLLTYRAISTPSGR